MLQHISCPHVVYITIHLATFCDHPLMHCGGVHLMYMKEHVTVHHIYN